MEQNYTPLELKLMKEIKELEKMYSEHNPNLIVSTTICKYKNWLFVVNKSQLDPDKVTFVVTHLYTGKKFSGNTIPQLLENAKVPQERRDSLGWLKNDKILEQNIVAEIDRVVYPEKHK